MQYKLAIGLLLVLTGALLPSTGCAPASADPVADSKKVAEIRVALRKKDDASVAEKGAADAGPAGFASLKGQFVLASGVEIEPLMKLLNPNIKPEERDVCAPGGRMPQDNSLLVDRRRAGSPT